jgi:hypothetical protein
MMTTFRLDSNQPQLAEAFRRASDLQRREAARLACERAASATEVNGPEVAAAIAAFRTGEATRPRLREDLEAAAARLDEEYFRLEEQGSDAAKAEALRLFSKARATSAFAFAMSTNPGDLHDAIYEALAAVDDPRDIVRAMETALK